MGRIQRKYEKGTANTYVSRNQAVKKLQLSLPDFRRLCILKGIYPHEPKNKKKAGKGDTTAKTYYHKKDIQFLLHEPIINKFRSLKIFARKIKKAVAKGESDQTDRLKQNKPKYSLDHIVKERYPSFVDAVRDMDDCLSMAALFSVLPNTRKAYAGMLKLCRRLVVEFMHYVINARALRKVFISIKGIYYQAEVMGQTITWIVPHNLGYEHTSDVDYKIMGVFVEFYVTLLGFINFRLYHTINLTYPPKLELFNEKESSEIPSLENISKKTKRNIKDMKHVSSTKNQMCTPHDERDERLAALTQSLKSISNVQEEEVELDEFSSADTNDPDLVEKAKVERDNLKKFQNLFKDLKFYLNREIPRENLAFVIRSFGGEVSWCETVAVGATYKETDETITHQIVDRPMAEKQYMSRYYVQPQWVFDCINSHKLIAVEDYFPGATLPPHLSPFVEDGDEDYVPPEKSGIEVEVSSEEEEDGEEDEEDEGVGVEDMINNDDDDDNDEESSEDEEEVEDDDDDEDEEDISEDDVDDEEPVAKKRKHGQKKLLNMSVEAGKVEKVDQNKQLKKQQDEEKKLSEMMIPKKKRRLYNKIMYSQKKKAQEARKLVEKRKLHEKKVKSDKRKSTG
ncbi:pescadillo homolog [Tubulanus polymorphus]|uniref:pescadillo homolog n=1 Tax=Tubulanus polymorphus TaxID=672921 RepID=UPI003DA4989A